MTTTAEVREFAGQVADYLDEHGWTQGSYQNGAGECCVFGAMNRVYDSDLYTRLATAIQNRVYNPDIYAGLATAIQDRVNIGVVKWNDAPGRTKDDVVGLLRSIQHGE